MPTPASLAYLKETMDKWSANVKESCLQTLAVSQESTQNYMTKQLDAMKLAHFDNEEVRKTISKIIISQFKKYLKIY